MTERVIHGGIDDAEIARAGLLREAILDLSANLHPDGPPEAVREAVRAAVASGAIGRYPSPDARPLREALAALHDVAPECVIVTPGASAAISLVLSTLLAPGARCLLFPPTFGEYARATLAAGAAVVSCLSEPPGFEVPGALPRAEAAVLCQPNNPTGILRDSDGIEALLGSVDRVVIDAAYEPLAERGDASAAVDLVRAGRPVVAIHSLTKLFAVPGLRLGYVVAAPALAGAIERRQGAWPVGAIEIAAGLAAVTEWPQRVATVAALHERRRRIEQACADMGLRTSISRANFVLAEVGGAADFRAALLRRGFAVRDATSFGLPDWVRIAVPPEAAMADLLSALGAVTAERRER